MTLSKEFQQPLGIVSIPTTQPPPAESQRHSSRVPNAGFRNRLSESEKWTGDSKGKYDDAYTAFHDQATRIISVVYDGTQVTTRGEHVITLQPGAISDAVVQRTIDQVELFFRPNVLALFGERLRTG